MPIFLQKLDGIFDGIYSFENNRFKRNLKKNTSSRLNPGKMFNHFSRKDLVQPILLEKFEVIIFRGCV